ncbi:MAG TPA: cytochrome c oxidase subunit 3 [Longimicrobiales bacterium]|nr:cytochrome c oxidase subunit 3 [Longimicrobiales bacterium]
MTAHAVPVDRGGMDATEVGMGVYNMKLGMWVFLLSEVMFFTSLIGGYIILRAAHPDMFAQPGEVLNVPLTALNTFLLICSSVTMVLAFAAVERGDQKWLRLWLVATALIGMCFLGVQIYEYLELSGHGFVPSVEGYHAEGAPLYGSTFYTMTGFHGFHVFVGVLALWYLVIQAFRGKYDANNHGAVEITGLYWHFVDLVWIILFTIVYLI